jgi:hypothetical protein
VSVSTGRAFGAAAIEQPDPSRAGATSAVNMSLAELQCAYSVLEYKHKNLQSRDRNGKRQKQNPKDKAPGKPKTPVHYCYAHGSQGSHTSAQCKVMAGQPHNFTAEMRKATNPNQPPGGSTFVKGQAQ